MRQFPRGKQLNYFPDDVVKRMSRDDIVIRMSRDDIVIRMSRDDIVIHELLNGSVYLVMAVIES